MKKVLFLIHDLDQGGAEKVLVNLVNNMDASQFDITVQTLFDVGLQRDRLQPHIHYKTCFRHMFRGNSHLMKLFSPSLLYRRLIKDEYDIVVSYLEGPSARIISGCPYLSKKICWIHCEQQTAKRAAASFRSYQEALDCYNSFDRIIGVSETVLSDFIKQLPLKVNMDILYNTNETAEIVTQAKEDVQAGLFSNQEIKLVGVGKLIKSKGFHRVLPIVAQLRKDGYPVHLYILGAGPMREELEKQAEDLGIANAVTLLGYQVNPYQYIAKCDLFVCASHAEGFSTAATEALIVGTPVCTVEVAGMKEMLGENNEWGIVTENDDEALYRGIRRLLDDPALLAHYKEMAAQRGRTFSTENTVHAVEEMLLKL